MIVHNNVHHQSLRELADGLAEGRISPTQAVEASLTRIAEAEPAVEAWVAVDPEGARDQARTLEKGRPDGPLWGIPVGIKDLIDVAGLPTGCGTTLRGRSRAPHDADCVTMLRKAGGIVLGKTVTTEFGYFAPGPTRNPWNLAHTPGGSSSGSAAAVASGMVPLAFGTQTAGSLTRPASFCGVAGFVGPVGQFSTAGITGLSRSLDSLGLLAPSVADLAFAWAALLQVPDPLPADVDTPRLVLWDGAELGTLTADMAGAMESAAVKLAAKGAVCEPLDMARTIRQLSEDHVTVMSYEAARTRAGEMDHLDQLSEPFKDLLISGIAVTDEAYRAAKTAIGTALTEIQDRRGDFDAILGPAALGAAPEGIDATGSPVLSRPWQALGLPVVSVPGLRDSSGMPLGVQVIGVPGREQQLFHTAQWVESVIG